MLLSSGPAPRGQNVSVPQPYRSDLPLQQFARARVGAVNEGAGYLRLLAVPDGALQALPVEGRVAVRFIPTSTELQPSDRRGDPRPSLPIPLNPLPRPPLVSTPPSPLLCSGALASCPGDCSNLLLGPYLSLVQVLLSVLQWYHPKGTRPTAAQSFYHLHRHNCPVPPRLPSLCSLVSSDYNKGPSARSRS